MANLDRLKGFDVHFNRAADFMSRFIAKSATEPGVWSKEQKAQIDLINGVLGELITAVGDLVANNR
jgi:hypothetical protein